MTTTPPDQQPPDRTDRFVADLADLRHDSSSRNQLMTRVGAALLIVGAAMAVLGLLLSQTTNNALDQSTDVSLGLAGIAVGLVGLAVFLRYSVAQFLRYWLLRIVHEQQQRRP